MRSSQRGALTVETALGATIFFVFIGYIFDFGILVHKRSMLLDATLKTVQNVTRDPQVAEDRALLEARTETLFTEISHRLSDKWNSGMHIEKIEIDCASQQIRVTSEWNAPCFFCFLGKFQRKLTAQSVGLLEAPVGSLRCA